MVLEMVPAVAVDFQGIVGFLTHQMVEVRLHMGRGGQNRIQQAKVY